MIYATYVLREESSFRPTSASVRFLADSKKLECEWNA